ncbi:MAG: MATE family efflux transporter [Lachnospiraceae bacterium]|nr:MATE family efflux transporter [Lachnospiraceae bacterium]
MATDFSANTVSKNIVSQAVPLILAQIVQILYNVVDRIYIGHLSSSDSLALTGIGLAFPLTALIMAFTQLFGMGGAPLFSMSMGAGEDDRAEKIMGNTFSLLIRCSLVLFVLCYVLRRPILFLFGASEASYAYADAYLRIYLFGTTFSMISAGMNGFINAQGFPGIGMCTTVIGAVLNLVLDPIFIFVFHMGVSGAATATVISQSVSALWVMRFLTGPKTLLHIRKRYLQVDPKLLLQIISLGLSGFIMSATTCFVQVLCNATLRDYGGDLYVGIMTVINSIREVLTLPVQGFVNGSQPVLSYDYGAGRLERVRRGIRFTSVTGIIYTALAWLTVILFPRFLLSIFTNNKEMLDVGQGALKLYFLGFCFMAFQFCGQTTFLALGRSKQAIFFSLLRKVIVVTPLTILLPRIGLGVNGVFLAEPISNVIGGSACFSTMYLMIYRRLKDRADDKI